MRRLIIILLVGLCLAPGTWLRSDITTSPPKTISLTRIAGADERVINNWQRLGVWEYDADSLMFGGYSALLALGDNTLRAFSDRGARFTFVEPDKPQVPITTGKTQRPSRFISRQLVEDKHAFYLWDIEGATRDPVSGQYWLSFESTHAFHRYSVGSANEGARLLGDEVDWSYNSGAEAMARLDDGRFVVIPESGGEGLIYPADPITGVAPSTFVYSPPERGFGITDAKQLPDGRLLLLLRNVIFGIPPFESRLAIAELPAANEPQILRPEFVLNPGDIIPPENYEGLAFRERKDGALDVWLISDDNLSAMQRTLVAKLRFDPAFEAQSDKQKARE